MTLREHQPEALDLLDATIARAREVVDAELLSLVEQHVRHAVADGPPPRPTADAREAAVVAVVDQMLVDVARVDDATVVGAAALLREGALADVVMASYAIEARTRLEVAADRLLGGMG